MTKYELKSIGCWSLFKFYGVLGLVAGLFILLMALFASSRLLTMGFSIDTVVQLENIVSSIWTALGAWILFGLITGICAGICGLIYNLVAAAVGGITVKLEN